MAKHFVVMAGGTGGHVVPGLSIAQALQEKGHSVSWMGTRAGIETQLVPAANIAIDYIDISGVRGKGLQGLLAAPFKIIHAFFQARRILKKVKADVVIGMGGFVAGPGGIAAKSLGLPLVIHEQNAIAGTTNKILAKFANHVLQAFDGAFALHPKVQTVGNPVRHSLVADAASVSEQDSPLKILVVGGSLGALALNDRIIALLQERDDINVLHQAGKRHIEKVRAQYQAAKIAPERFQLHAYIDDMQQAYQWADIVFCRSGAMTVSELSCALKPAIFVPFPFAIDDHQTANANVMVRAGAAILMKQSDMNSAALNALIQPLIDDKKQLMAMAEKAKAIRITNAGEKIVAVCEELAQ